MNKGPKKYNIVNASSNKEICDVSDLERMQEQIKEISSDGLLHFTISTNKDGWIAQCEEIGGIITGGINPNPAQNEIVNQIKDAVYSTFDVHCITNDEQRIKSPFIQIRSIVSI